MSEDWHDMMDEDYDLGYDDDDYDDDYDDEFGSDDFHDDIFEDDDYEPDLEQDRFSVWSEEEGDYLSVYAVPRLIRWRRFAQYDLGQLRGRFYRFCLEILRHFRRCDYCGKLGVGPYYWSNTCSDKCHEDWWKLRLANTPKLHIQNPRRADRALCGEPTSGIHNWNGRIKTGTYSPETRDEFCTTCLKKAKK